MNWERLGVLGSQCVVVIVLGVLVGLGHNSAINDALLAVSGSIAGVGVYQTVTRGKPPGGE